MKYRREDSPPLRSRLLRISQWSLRYKFIVALLAGGAVVSGFGVWSAQKTAYDTANRILVDEARAVASAINHSAMVAADAFAVRHVVEEMASDNPSIKNIVIALREPNIVLASTSTEWDGRPVSEITDDHLRIEISDALRMGRTDHHYEQESVLQMLVPLGNHMVPQMNETAHGLIMTKSEAAQSGKTPAGGGMADDAGEHARERPDQPASATPSTHDHASTRGIILVQLDRSNVNASTKTLTGQINATVFGIVVMSMLLAFALVKRQVLSPLDSLQAAMNERRRGKRDARAPVISDDEIGRTTRDFNEMLDAIESNEENLRQLSMAVEQSPGSVLITDPQGQIQYVNRKFVEVTGYSAKEIIGQTPQLLKSGRTPNLVYQQLWTTITAGQEWRGELFNKKKDGTMFWEHVSISPIKNTAGLITHFVAVKEDISVRKDYEAKLLKQANFDSLTGLPNRVLALDRLNQALARAGRDRSRTALMFIDLDGFKKVNDTMGHDAGDKLLTMAAARIDGCLRESDTVARFGGDEFIVILPDVNDPVDAELVAEKILRIAKDPFELEESSAYISASIGITVFPDDGSNPQILMRNADTAMYRAKHEGRNTFRFFTPSMNARAQEHLLLENELRQAVVDGGLVLHFQPLVSIADKKIIGAEALLRWTSPTLGPISPDRFIPIAEETGLISDIGAWVLKTACREVAVWNATHERPVYVAVNLSSHQFRKGDLVKDVTDALAAADLSPKYLELEVTEGALLSDSSDTDAIIQELTSEGIRFAIDDFGTGYSSISYLRRYPFSTLKIDRSFIQDLASNRGDETLVRSIIAMAKGMNLRVVGEGIEDADQLEILADAKCDVAQGWLFGKAVSAADFPDFLKPRRWGASAE